MDQRAVNKSMSAVGCLLSVASLAIASGAAAQVTAVVTGGGSTVTLGTGGNTTVVTSHNTSLQINDAPDNYAGNFQVVSDLTPNDIVFANNASAAGAYTSVTSSTSLAITYTNTGPAAVVPQLTSEITPGGFGFYSELNVDNGTSIGDINNAAESTGASFSGYATSAPFLAGASFSINIASDGVVFESLSGTVTISPAVLFGMNAGPPAVTLTLGGAAASLNGFGLLTAVGSQSEVGYQWDTTDLNLTIPGGALAPGDTRTLTYDTQVTAFTSANTALACGGVLSCPQLFAFSGFGDPIGKGGGGGPPAAAEPAGLAAFGSGAPSGISDVYFPRFQFGLPTFDPITGDLSLPLSQQELPALPLSIPEPGTWALMLVGIGAVGWARRRSARPSAA
jgi:hypothetical protein